MHVSHPAIQALVVSWSRLAVTLPGIAWAGSVPCGAPGAEAALKPDCGLWPVVQATEALAGQSDLELWGLQGSWWGDSVPCVNLSLLASSLCL